MSASAQERVHHFNIFIGFLMGRKMAALGEDDEFRSGDGFLYMFQALMGATFMS